MKKLVIIISLFLAVACNKDTKYEQLIQYSFEWDESTKWINIDYDNGYQLIVINNNEKLKKYLPEDTTDYPVIDFSKHTLLLACGRTRTHPRDFTYSFKKNSTDNYMLNIKIYDGFAYGYPAWIWSGLTNKLSEESKVELNVTQIP